MGTFFIISTPIGNMEDITLRALRVLREVDLILCEDTRETGKILKHYDIQNKMQSYHANSKLSKIDTIISYLESGKNIALVSDAGTPIISDPGILLVQEIKKQLSEVQIVPVPGASALLSAVVASGINCHEFIFLGFLPHKKGRETLFKEIAENKRAVVFYESVHRIEKTLDSLVEHLDRTGKRVSIGRELTKLFEEIFTGTPEEVRNYFKKHTDKIRGEFVVIVGV
ncbi:MAG: uroporphyrin-III C/tetrapyrrole (Corrin/Porphyrin) methyltransferase, rRNA [Candidatus Parcubacteria bacterium]|jgi:16S rRNA (cytidine1402-2'-O)-methyltransferase